MRPIYNDELYHYGKLGMKWGKRTSAIKEGISAQVTMQKNALIHPIHSTAAQISMIKKNPVKGLLMTKDSVKELNADVKNRIDAETRKKKTIKEYQKQINAGASTVGKIYNKLTDADKYQAQIMYAQRHSK